MDLVIDANILVSALVKTKGYTYDLIFNDKIKLYAPEYILEEFEEHKQEILQKSKLSEYDLKTFLSLIKERIDIIPLNDYENFNNEAEKISPDSDDAEYFALALKLNSPIWSRDARLKGQNRIKVYNIEEVARLIKNLENEYID